MKNQDLNYAKDSLRVSVKNKGKAEGEPILLEPRETPYVVGRKTRGARKTVDIAVSDRHVSKRHCEIYWSAEGGWSIRDLNTTNGTYLEEEQIFEPCPIEAGQDVRIGTSRLIFRFDPLSLLATEVVGRNDDAVTDSGGGSDESEPVDTRDFDDETLVLDDKQDEGARSNTKDGRAAVAAPAKTKTKSTARADQRAEANEDAATLDTEPATGPAEASDETIVMDDNVSVGDQDADTADKPDDKNVEDGVAEAATGRSAASDSSDETSIADDDSTIAPDESASTFSSDEATLADPVETSSGDRLADEPVTKSRFSISGALGRLGIGGRNEKSRATDHDSASAKPRERWRSTRLKAIAKDGTEVSGDDSLTQAVAAPSVGKSEEVRQRRFAPRAPAPTVELAVGIEHLPTFVQELIESDLLTKEKALDLARRARELGVSFFSALSKQSDIVTKTEIFKAVARAQGMQLIENDTTLEKEHIEVDWLTMLVAERRGILALAPTKPERVRYACIDPFDVRTLDWVARVSGAAPASVDVCLVLPQALTATIQRIKGRESSTSVGEIGLAINISIDQERDLRARIADTNVPQMVNFFIHRGQTQKASDIHVEPTEDALMVRNRVDGILREDTTLPRHLHREIVSRIKIMSGMDVAEKRRPQDGRIGAIVRGTPIDVRVSTYPTVHGEKIVLRLLDKNALRPSPETLGLLARDLRILKDKISAPYGLIMISGPTGSGKTTTLYSCLGSVDKTAKNVLTIEDPVEYRLKGVHQMQVNEKIKLTFASGLRTILRQDPDVIMIGECRDQDTASMAIQASLTGHIVFSTIHTNDAVGVVTRLLDMGLDRFLVANALSLAIAQRLVRNVCSHCSISVPGTDVLNALKNEGISNERLLSLDIEIEPDLLYLKGAGCMHCNNTGYLGRRAVFEVFEMTSKARTMIMASSFNSDDLRDMAEKSGMVSILRHGLHLVEEGITTHEEVLRVLGEAS